MLWGRSSPATPTAHQTVSSSRHSSRWKLIPKFTKVYCTDRSAQESAVRAAVCAEDTTQSQIVRRLIRGCIDKRTGNTWAPTIEHRSNAAR
jgi:hypothetical protein